MSGKSVWYENVDTALKKFIQDIILFPKTVVEDPAPLTTYVSIPVEITKPEEKYKSEQYPCCTITHLYAAKDYARVNAGDNVVVSRDAVHGTLVVEKQAIPYNLFYQIDFWTTKQSDMNTILKLWIANTDEGFNLTVTDDSGDDSRTCFAKPTVRLQHLDLVKDRDRLFRCAATIKVWVELDEESAVEKPMVSTIDMNLTRTE